MATKAELLERAKAQGLEVNSRSTKAELEEALNASSEGTTTPSLDSEQRTAETQKVESVEVNKNEGGEATHGTSKDGEEAPVKNTDSIPQNDVSEIEVAETTDNPVAKRADSERTTESVEFSDESNPNQKSRVASTDGDKYDQDGNLRTGGYSYGVAPDDTRGTVFEEENKGEEPDENNTDMFNRVSNEPIPNGSFLNSTTNADEWDIEDQQKLEESLSSPEDGIRARVTTSAGSYVRIKFFRNNKPLATYRSRNFKEGDATKFLNKVRKELDV